jgi:heme/copper-type cytochrome/quinol oxidase subunit 3
MTAVTMDDRDGKAAVTAMWLFIASVVMFYGAIFSGYVLLRAGSPIWDTPWRTGPAADWPYSVDHWFRTMWLGFAVIQARRLAGEGVPNPGLRRFSVLIALAGAAFVWRCWYVGSWLSGIGYTPSSSVSLACWYALNGTVATLVAGGAAAALWVAIDPVAPEQRARRGVMLQRYWILMLVLWVATVAGLYVG